jgi:hypothetical protein
MFSSMIDVRLCSKSVVYCDNVQDYLRLYLGLFVICEASERAMIAKHNF